MTDTDSDMMRRQQNMDTPQTIEDGVPPNGAGPGERRGLDALGDVSGNGQDAVLAQNVGGGADNRPASRRRSGGLVQRGRSLLGR